MSADGLLFEPLLALATAIRQKKLSPVALTQAYLARSERVGTGLGAYATLTKERALAQARAAEAELRAGNDRGPLHGLPFAAKDLLAAKGYPTTWGAKPFASQRFDFDAAVIERLSAAGAVLIGKASVIELAGGMGYRFASASLQGACKNPWSTAHWTCGSSSGSAAVAGAALASFAIGSETWGSIVCPAAFSGVTGLRPTYGRVSRRGAMSLSPSMDKLGVLARSADDCALVLAAIAGHDPGDAASRLDAAFSYELAAPRGKLKLGVVTNAWKAPGPAVASAFDAALGAMRGAGHSVVDVTLPLGPWDDAASTIIRVEGAAAFASFIDKGGCRGLSDPLGRAAPYVNRVIPAADYVRAQQIRAYLQPVVDALFDHCDVLVAPSMPVAAPRVDANLDDSLDFPDPLGAIGNLCGLPAVSAPMGQGAHRLPLGLAFVGRAMDDDVVLHAARAFQSITTWHKARP